MADPVTVRRSEQKRLIGVARDYVEQLATRVPLLAAAVAGSVARGDFNVWSDIDVVIVAERLPRRVPERTALLGADAPAGVQPIGFTPEEFSEALEKRNALAREALERGLVLLGEGYLRSIAAPEP